MKDQPLSFKPHAIDSEILCKIVKVGREALNGDSNDAEHDALYEIVSTIESLLSGDSQNSESSEVNLSAS